MNAQQERFVALRSLLRSRRLLNDAVKSALDVPARTNGILAQVVFFFLAALALSSFHGLFRLVALPGGGILTAIAGIGLAEYLMRAHRWFWTGVESALWLGGLLALISELPRTGAVEALLLIAAACGAAAWRVRNPAFSAVAAILVIAYFEIRFDRGVIAALVLGAVAMLALLRTWQRPSTEWTCIAIAIAAPVAGAVAADARWRPMTIALYSSFAVIALVLGLARRHHAFFASAMIATCVAAFYASPLLAMKIEAQLAIAGAILGLAAIAIARALRGRTRGFVTTPSHHTESLEILATLAMQPQASAPPQEPAPAQGGGGFGGAGASGEF